MTGEAAPPAGTGHRTVTTSLDGCLVVDKPAGWTSHDVVARARRLLGTRRVGHAGTLDPDATGVLVIGVGRGTRLLRFATLARKTYVGEVALGVATSTLDASGDVTARADMEAVTPEEVRMAALSLTGRLEQVPPMVSAVKIGGRRLHDLAREGIEVERPPRPVEVFRFDVFETGLPSLYRAIVECSSGTYVRVLAADLGERLGGVAHLRSLRRLAVGSFSDAEAIALEDISPERLLPLLELVRDLPSARLDERGRCRRAARASPRSRRPPAGGRRALGTRRPRRRARGRGGAEGDRQGAAGGRPLLRRVASHQWTPAAGAR